MARCEVTFLQNEPELVSELTGWQAQATPAVKAEIAKLQDGDAIAKVYAARELRRIDSRDARAAVLVLLNTLSDDTSLELRVKRGESRTWERYPGHTSPAEEACRTLVSIGKPAVNGLAAALQDPREHVREGAAASLEAIALHSPSILKDVKQGTYTRAINALIKALNDKYPSVRDAAVEALGAIKSPVAVPALIKALSDGHALIRWHAAIALGRIKDPSATGALKRAAQDEDDKVRSAASHALKLINSNPVPLR